MNKLFIKNMVCDRCKTAVQAALEKQGISPLSVELGEVTLGASPSELQITQLGEDLRVLGFELITDKNARMISKIKGTIIDFIRNSSGKLNFSDYLSDKLHKDYSSLSTLFSQVEGITIEKYLIHQKIERVKELLVYDELSLGQIADKLNYSSINHLSSQFKKITGLTPSHFKKVGNQKRLSLDQL